MDILTGFHKELGVLSSLVREKNVIIDGISLPKPRIGKIVKLSLEGEKAKHWHDLNLNICAHVKEEDGKVCLFPLSRLGWIE